MKKFLIVLVILLVAVAAAGFVWLRQKEEPKPQEGSDKPVAIVRDEVISPVFSKNQESIWYFTSKGRLFQINLADKKIDEDPFGEEITGLEAALWQSNENNIILERQENGRLAYALFDREQKAINEYPVNLDQPRFLIGNTKIVYKWHTDGGLQLQMADLDAKNYTTQTDLFQDYNLISSPVYDEVLLYGGQNGKSFLYELSQKSFTDLPSGVRGGIFSPDGEKILLEVLTDGQTSLRIYDRRTRGNSSIDLKAGISQAAWDKSGNIAIVTSSGLNVYEPATKQIKKAADFVVPGLRPKDVLFNQDAKAAYFVDGSTGFLYEIKY